MAFENDSHGARRRLGPGVRQGGAPPSGGGEGTLFDRVPPHDDAAERAVLGGMLLSKDALGEVSGIIEPGDFYDPRNEIIYDLLIELYGEGSKPVDVIVVADELKTRGQLDKVGGSDYLADLAGNEVPIAANAISYAHIVHEKAVLRRVIQAGTRIAQMGYDTGNLTAEEVVNRAQAQMYDLGIEHVRQDYVQIGDALNSALDLMDMIQRGGEGSERGVPTGFAKIDETTGGLQPGQMIVIGARPAMGKSTLGVDFARSAALHNGRPTIIFSLEMSRLELTQRILSAEASIPLNLLRAAKDLDENDWAKLNRVADMLSDKPLFIDDSPNMSLMEIRAKCRRLKQTEDLQLVVVDYLQLMSSDHAVESRQQEVSGFSRALKLLAKELEIPIVALCQLNRESEARADKTPMLSDLRESGAIEQDADVVFLINRPEVYNKDDRPGEADIILAKHRNGPTGVFPLSFQGNLSRFQDMAADPTGGI